MTLSSFLQEQEAKKGGNFTGQATTYQTNHHILMQGQNLTHHHISTYSSSPQKQMEKIGDRRR
jgi:hypothetical protein